MTDYAAAGFDCMNWRDTIYAGGDLLPVANAVLCMGAVALSFGPMANTVVFAFMGMAHMSEAQGYLVFACVGLAAWCVSVIAAFSGIAKKAH